MTDTRIATLDIETAPYLAYVWQLWDTNVNNDMIVEDATILSCAIKPLGKKAEYFDVSAEKNPRDDRKLMNWIWERLDKIDIVVTQNGKKFDIPRINARMAYYQMRPPSPYSQVDTRQEARKTFKFASNKLEWLSDKLTDIKKSKHKKFPGFELWQECLNGNAAAWAEMKKYNIRDVESTEEVYLALRPWMPTHPNRALMVGVSQGCPKCASLALQKRGFYYTSVRRYQRYQCMNCHGWTRGTTNIKDESVNG